MKTPISLATATCSMTPIAAGYAITRIRAMENDLFSLLKIDDHLI